MKKIKLITTHIKSNSQVPEDFELSYRREFLRIVEIIQEGVTASQMGVAINVARKLQDTPDNSVVYLEDSEHEYLLNKARAFKFMLVASEIVEMIAAIEQAEPCHAPPHLARDTDQKTAGA